MVNRISTYRFKKGLEDHLYSTEYASRTRFHTDKVVENIPDNLDRRIMEGSYVSRRKFLQYLKLIGIGASSLYLLNLNKISPAYSHNPETITIHKALNVPIFDKRTFTKEQFEDAQEVPLGVYVSEDYKGTTGLATLKMKYTITDGKIHLYRLTQFFTDKRVDVTSTRAYERDVSALFLDTKHNANPNKNEPDGDDIDLYIQWHQETPEPEFSYLLESWDERMRGWNNVTPRNPPEFRALAYIGNFDKPMSEESPYMIYLASQPAKYGREGFEPIYDFEEKVKENKAIGVFANAIDHDKGIMTAMRWPNPPLKIPISRNPNYWGDGIFNPQPIPELPLPIITLALAVLSTLLIKRKFS